MAAGMRNVREYGDAIAAGQRRHGHFRKVPGDASTAGWWVDLSRGPGSPPPNFFATDPLTAATLAGLRGIFAGSDVSPQRKFLTDLALCSPTAGLVGQFKLCDYLLYYPFIDLDDTTEQPMDNAVTLPRYPDGVGVQAIMVCLAPTTGGGSFTFNYVDQDGNAKTSPTIFCSTAAANISSVITSEQATAAGGQLFLPLASGSSGIRSITSITMLVPNGGLGCIVLVAPLADHAIREASVPAEVSYLSMRAGPPRVYDGAFLGMFVNCAATVAAGTLTGRMSTVWN